MCGIGGVLDESMTRDAQQETMQRMLHLLKHRGPDESGWSAGPGYAIGATRLALVSPQDGRQPFVSCCGNLVMVCNGEIYDHRELRRQLQLRGHTFVTGSDCEILLHLYEERGRDFLVGIEGQFAVAILDIREGRLLLARDPAGILPLYFTVLGTSVLFASEIKPIVEAKAQTWHVDPVAVDQTLSLTGVIAPWTIVSEIASVRPGEIVDIMADRSVHKRRYWQLPVGCHAEQLAPASIEERDERFRTAMTRAVARRLDADREIGLYVSGGLDSGVLAALATELQPDDLQSFGVSVRAPGLDEAAHQWAVADWLGLRHDVVEVGIEELSRDLPLAVAHAGCPIKESFDAAAMALSRRVHERGLRAVLGGQGADELLGGYVGYRFDAAVQRADISPTERAVRRRLWGVEDFVYEKHQAAFAATKQTLFAKGFLPDLDFAWAEENPVIDRTLMAELDPFDRRTLVDFELRLGNHLLSDHGDRMAMANSVEVRYPFLDQDVIRTALSYSPSERLVDLQEKIPLKRLGRSLLPSRVIEREKFGFACPGTPAFLQAGHAWVRDVLSSQTLERQGIFDPEVVAKTIDAYSVPGFTINVPLEEDHLMVVLTTTMIVDQLGLAT